MGQLKYCRISTRNTHKRAQKFVTTPILPSLTLCDSASVGFIAANPLDQNYTWVFYAEFEVHGIADETNITASVYVRA